MTKVAGLLAILGLGLLLASLFPWPGGSAEAGLGQPDDTDLISEAEHGRALFLAKGCATCHRHEALGDLAGQAAIGPNLSVYRPDPEFVRRWLRDPAAIRPSTQMPDLALNKDEITALIAFLDAAGAGEASTDLAIAFESCPVTQPADPPFDPPEPDPAQGDGLPKASSLGSFDAYFWHGSESLWTQLRRDGVWQGLPHNERGYTQKLFFSREGYNWIEEPLPALTVSGRRLDTAGAFEELEATNGFHPEVGSFMLAGVDIPTAGCWQITGQYAGHELSFVVWVEPA